MNKLVLILVIFTSLNLLAQEDWKPLFEEQNLKAEIQYTPCYSVNVNNQELLLFRFTNTSNEVRTYTWRVKVWRNDICTNCDKIDSDEFLRTITLSPGESISGDCLSKENNALYIFGRFIELVPGMSEQSLTNYEFIELTSVTH